MSRSIWTQCAAEFEYRTLALDATRVVESQYLISTRKLVDSDDEQALLEELVDSVKPPIPSGKRFGALHYLLLTPFRHPPLRHGTRFGTVVEPGIWYGSREEATAFAEVAYYRLLFLAGSAAALAPITVELTSFVAGVATKKGADLTVLPFARHAAALTSRTSYAATQTLGTDLRAAGVEAFVFTSARARTGGTNVALFVPAFTKKTPKKLETWICTADSSKVEIAQKTFSRTGKRYGFPREDFAVKGRLPSPSV